MPCVCEGVANANTGARAAGRQQFFFPPLFVHSRPPEPKLSRHSLLLLFQENKYPTPNKFPRTRSGAKRYGSDGGLHERITKKGDGKKRTAKATSIRYRSAVRASCGSQGNRRDRHRQGGFWIPFFFFFPQPASSASSFSLSIILRLPEETNSLINESLSVGPSPSPNAMPPAQLQRRVSLGHRTTRRRNVFSFPPGDVTSLFHLISHPPL